MSFEMTLKPGDPPEEVVVQDLEEASDEQLAEHWGVTTRTVRKWIGQGLLGLSPNSGVTVTDTGSLIVMVLVSMEDAEKYAGTRKPLLTARDVSIRESCTRNTVYAKSENAPCEEWPYIKLKLSNNTVRFARLTTEELPKARVAHEQKKNGEDGDGLW